MSIIKKIIKVLKVCRQTYKRGGYTEVMVSYTKPDSKLKGKRVLVTGGSSGIGYAIAQECALEGAEVLICARGKSRINQALSNMNMSNVQGMVLDIAEVQGIPNKLEEALKIMKSFDVFVNCAGVSSFDGDLMSETIYDRILNINTKGLFYMCKAESEYFVKNKRIGKIINITSACDDKAQFDPYTISKWGARCLTLGLAKKMIDNQILVNGIAPGEVPTNITRRLQGFKDNGDGNYFTELHRTHRLTMAKEIARIAVYLASDESNNVNGQIIAVDGGIHSR